MEEVMAGPSATAFPPAASVDWLGFPLSFCVFLDLLPQMDSTHSELSLGSHIMSLCFVKPRTRWYFWIC